MPRRVYCDEIHPCLPDTWTKTITFITPWSSRIPVNPQSSHRNSGKRASHWFLPHFIVSKFLLWSSSPPSPLINPFNHNRSAGFSVCSMDGRKKEDERKPIVRLCTFRLYSYICSDATMLTSLPAVASSDHTSPPPPEPTPPDYRFDSRPRMCLPKQQDVEPACTQFSPHQTLGIHNEKTRPRKSA